MRLQPSAPARAAAIAGDQHRKPFEHGLELGEIGTALQPPARWPAEESRRAAEDSNILRCCSDAPAGRQQAVLAQTVKRLDPGEIRLVDLLSPSALRQQPTIE